VPFYIHSTLNEHLSMVLKIPLSGVPVNEHRVKTNCQ